MYCGGGAGDADDDQEPAAVQSDPDTDSQADSVPLADSEASSSSEGSDEDGVDADDIGTEESEVSETDQLDEPAADERTVTDSDAPPINADALQNVDLTPLCMPAEVDSPQVRLARKIFCFKEKFLSTQAYAEFAGTTSYGLSVRRQLTCFQCSHFPRRGSV